MSRIMVLNAKTGGARQVVGVEGFDPAFSPDGHSLAFKRILGPDTNAKRIEGIWIVGLDGSTLHQVTNVDPRVPAAFSDSSPQFSPDGKMLVFERTRLEDGDSAVFVQSLDSSGSPEDARQITPWKMECGITPEFSPDGKLVLFRCGPWLEPPPCSGGFTPMAQARRRDCYGALLLASAASAELPRLGILAELLWGGGLDHDVMVPRP